jgi:hypothetical protein
MSPRLGGPRFTEQPEKEAAQRLVDDPRSNEQIALDVLVDLVTAGASADPAEMPAPGPPVRVTMTIDDLLTRVAERTEHLAPCRFAGGSVRDIPDDSAHRPSGDRLTSNSLTSDRPTGNHPTGNHPTGNHPIGNRLIGSTDHLTGSSERLTSFTARDTGHSSTVRKCVCPVGEVATGVAMVEGHPELISAATARRFLCNQGAIPVVLDGASVPMDVGRSRRFFTPGQRVALAVRDRGCRWPGCDRPPSWTEAHHIDQYQHGGKTDLRDGIMLCRRHHQLLHNAGWHITRHHPSRHHLNNQRQCDPGGGELSQSREPANTQGPSHTPGHDLDPGFWLRPPASFDQQRQPIPMPPNGPAPGG